MILNATDIVDWISDNDRLLIAAWAPQISNSLGWEHVFASALAAELHDAMVTTFLRKGGEGSFLGIVKRSNTGLDDLTERVVCTRFYDVTLKLARAACRRRREDRSRSAFPYKRAFIVGDGRINSGHSALDNIVLPYDHPFWRRWHPPIDMDCRCGAVPLTKFRFARLGLSLTSDAELQKRRSQLRGDWPPEFLPLLDFRSAIYE